MAQGLNSAYFTEGYTFRSTLNPAFDSEYGYVSLPGLGNVQATLRGNFGYEDILLKNPLFGGAGQKKMVTFMHPNISAEEALKGFNRGTNRLSGDINLALLAVGFRAFGGFNTISVNVHTAINASLPYGLFEFAKEIGNNHYDIGDIELGAEAFAEFAIGHSHDIDERWRVGVKLKALFGGARLQAKLQGVTADMGLEDIWLIKARGEAKASMKGLKYKSKSKEYDVMPGSYDYINDIDIDGAGIGGFGGAIDLGVVFTPSDYWSVSLALLDLGFISWSNELVAKNSSEEFSFTGFHDITASDDRGEDLDTQIDKYMDQIADFAHLKDMGDNGSKLSMIEATANVGVEYALPAYPELRFGVLGSYHLFGPYSWGEGRLSVNCSPLSWVEGNVNAAINNFTQSIGFVLNFHPRGFNFFIGADHIVGKVSKEFIPLKSNASLNLGMNITF